MAVALTEKDISASVPTVPPRKTWTREEFENPQLREAFHFEQFELIEGELIGIIGKNRPYVTALHGIFRWLVSCLGPDFVQQESPIDVAPRDNGRNEPQPDVVVLRESYERFSRRNPQPKDIVMIVELADSSLAFDLRTKAEIYARAQIAEYWVVDVNSQSLIVHRRPELGSYASVMSYSRSEAISPQGFPQHSLTISAIFPGPIEPRES